MFCQLEISDIAAHSAWRLVSLCIGEGGHL